MTNWVGKILDEHTMRKLGFYQSEVTSFSRKDSEDMEEFYLDFSDDEIAEFYANYSEDSEMSDSDREIAEIFLGQNDNFERREHEIWYTYRPIYDVANMRLRVEVWDDGEVEISIAEFDPTIGMNPIDFSYEEIVHNDELRQAIDLSLEIFVDYGVIWREIDSCE